MNESAEKGNFAPNLSYEEWFVDQLKDSAEAAAYNKAVVVEGDDAAISLAFRQVARARQGAAE